MNSHTTHTPTINAADEAAISAILCGRLMLGVHGDHADEHALEVERARHRRRR
jgi:hypothetical protein